MVFIRAPMPTVTPQQGGGQASRTSFRPPWVKEAPPGIPMPTAAPWMRARESRVSRDEGQPSAVSHELMEARDRLNAVEGTTKPPVEPTPAPVRKLSKITIIPSRPLADPAENGVQAKQIQSSTVTSKGTAQEEPTLATTEPQAKQTQDTPAAKGRTQEPKQPAPELQAKQTLDTATSKGRTKEAKEPATESQAKQTQPTPATKGRTQEPKVAAMESQGKQTQPTPAPKRRTQEPKEPAADPKPVAGKDKIPEQPKQTIPVKERYKDGKPNGPKEKRISIDVTQEKKVPVEEVREKTIPVVIKKEVSNMPVAPPAPTGPPMPPPPPPSMAGMKGKPLDKLKIEKIEALRSRPRRRPDWGTMMKEIESGRKLNHIVCNDRSAPLLATPVKVKEQFMYESEKPNVHNRLLEQINQGVQLKRVKTNDRSKPILDGLRKFRRQMTIEEQTAKEAVAVLAEPDELDDIDKVRDDLQSTKQMLALELRNKEAMDRENKRLQARLLNLEVELEKERAARLKEQSPQVQRLQDEEENRKLKSELNAAQKMAEDMENKFHETAGQLEMTRGELEDLQRKAQIMERRMSNYAGLRDGDQPITKQPSAKRLAKSNSAIGKPPTQVEAEEEESDYDEETESEDSSEEEEDEAALQERRTARELKLLSTKVRSFKDKTESARKERCALRAQLRTLTATLREEKKRYKVLQREVESMASVLKEDEDEESEESEEEETESESESETETESEAESEGDLPADAPAESRRANLSERSKRHENALAALKKGNYMLKANVDRVKDDLFKQKEMAITLQEDLNAVLAELG